MNPRQRRAILLLALSFLGLLGVFGLVASYVANVRQQVTPTVRVLQLTKSVGAHSGVEDDAVTETTVPRHWAPHNALSDPAQLVGLVTATDLPADTVLQQGMLVPPPRLAPGQREMAIDVDAETGVAGLLQPDDQVDIVAAYTGANQGPDVTEVVVPGARVLEVGQPQVKGGQGVKEATADPQQVVPITFALTARQVLLVEHAETFASEVRLALLRPGEQSILTKREKFYARLP
jgi:pilus assembly protein CpaB